MDDMNAFERLVAAEVQAEAGPSRPTDVAAVIRTAAAKSSRWRFQSMFSATKFVVAGAIVALFGGFLLTGVLTQQPNDEQLPAVGASASTLAEPTHPVPTSLEPSTEPSAVEETTPLVWERVEIPAGMDYESLRFSTGTYLVATSPRQTLVSRDGLSWSEVPVRGEVIDAYGGTLVVADGDRLSTVRIPGDATASKGLIALDGLSLPPETSRRNAKIAYGPTGLMFVTCEKSCGTFRTVWRTVDGRTWERVKKLPRGGFEDVTATADGFVARTDLGGRWDVLYSRDGRTWRRVNGPIAHRYELVGSAPFGTLLQKPDRDGSPTRALALVTRYGLEPLKVPAKVKARWARSEPDGWGAGGLGVVGVFDGMVAVSADGTTWHLGTLPDSVPHLRFGDNGDGRPLLHVTEDMVLLETTMCLEPDPLEGSPIPPYAKDRSDRAEVDCPGLHGSGQKTVWFRGVTS